MFWIASIALLVLLLVAATVFFGPPYLPTLRTNMDAAFKLLDLDRGQTLLELGSGDGRVLLAAAKRGLSVVGIELSPVLVVISWLRTRRYRKHVKIVWGNYFRVAWPPADGIFVFMIGRQMARLNGAVEQWHDRPVRLVSVAFKIPDKKPSAMLNGVFLYRYK